jgi:hypothetical protein
VYQRLVQADTNLSVKRTREDNPAVAAAEAVATHDTPRVKRERETTERETKEEKHTSNTQVKIHSQSIHSYVLAWTKM